MLENLPLNLKRIQKSLYFTEFRKFEDPLEGTFPDGNRKETLEVLEKAFEGNQAMLDHIHKENPIYFTQKGLRSWKFLYKLLA